MVWTMTKASGNAPDDESDFIPLTPEQAQRLIAQNPSLSVWWVLAGQLVVGVVAAVLAGALTGKGASAWSAFYGSLVVVIPGALFARGLRSQFSSISAVTAGFGFFVWEAVKIGVSVSMLAAAPRLVADLDWLAMLIGLILTLKVYWLALLVRHKRKIA
jgi:ATP synthase protein I